MRIKYSCEIGDNARVTPEFHKQLFPSLSGFSVQNAETIVSSVSGSQAEWLRTFGSG